MIVVKIELWPHGDQSQAKQIGWVDIANDGTGDVVESSYKVSVRHGGKYFGKAGFYRIGKVNAFKRELSPYHLVSRALQACGIK